jgi:hypothetical protein
MFKRLLIILPFVVCATLSASAGNFQPFQNNVPPQCPYMDVDLCFAWAGDGTGVPPQSDSCTAAGGARCQVCATDAASHQPRCGSVTMDASCTCDQACTESGKCVYRR